VKHKRFARAAVPTRPVPQMPVDIPAGAALWRVYVMGRWGVEQELGFVVAPAHGLSWLRSSPALACDVVKG
jgi:hypothetical protein